ncbi:MAG: DNA ligase [Kurthia sp.]|nr:DNA ligase [Candidatus Kurthia equi]
MLLHMGKEIEDDANWLYEIKWDGWRIIIHKQGDRVEAYTRHGNNVTNRFPELKDVGRSILAHTAIIDTEGVVLRNGVSAFDDFAYRGRLTNTHKIQEAMITHPVTFIAFDVLYTDDGTHINEPLLQRKERLVNLIQPSNVLMITPSVIGEGKHIFEITKENKLEGVVGKKIDSIYQLNHRSADWLKFKHFKISAAVILGYKERPFQMIVGNYFKNGTLRAVATLEFGFKLEEKQAFKQIAQNIITKKEKDVTWLEPSLVCNVQYLEKTDNGKLRIASFKGFNFDKDPKDCFLN